MDDERFHGLFNRRLKSSTRIEGKVHFQISTYVKSRWCEWQLHFTPYILKCVDHCHKINTPLLLQVIVGNNRCSLTGKDLNRQYRTVIRETYPPVWHTKVMIRRLVESIKLILLNYKIIFLINCCVADCRRNVALLCI